MKNFIAILLLLWDPVFGQITWQEGYNFNAVSFSHNNECIAVGGGIDPGIKISTIVKAEEEGIAHNILRKDTILHAVSFGDLNHGTAVGVNGLILRTTDGGNTWLNQESNLNTTIRGVSFVDKDFGVAISLNKILRTSDGGETWINEPSGIISSLFGISFVNKDLGFVAGSGGKIFKTTDGGASWKPQTSGTIVSLHAISFDDENNGVAVGQLGVITKTTDGGNIWELVNSGTENHLYGVSYVDSNWTAVGDWGTIIRNEKKLNSGTTNRLNSVSFYDENNGAASGWFGTLLRTSDGGKTWVSRFYNQVHSYKHMFNNSTRSYYVFLPKNYDGQDPLPLMIVLNGSGGTGEGALDGSRMSSVSDTSNFIAVFPSWGASWIIENEVEFVEQLIDSLAAKYNVDLARIYVTGFSRGAITSHEIGCKLPNKIAAIAPVAGYIDQTTISNCLSNASPPVLYMHGTRDMSVPFSTSQQVLDFWIGRNNANVSVDTIDLPDIDTTDGSIITKYLFKNSSGEARVVFYKIVNGYHNWPNMLYEPNEGIINRDIVASEEIWNFVKDFSLSPTDISENINLIHGNLNLVQNYPNPFNPRTTISWQSPVGSHLTLKIYDLLGREVATLVNEYKPAGSYEVEFEASELSSGTYFYRLQAGEFAAAKKLVLLK